MGNFSIKKKVKMRTHWLERLEKSRGERRDTVKAVVRRKGAERARERERAGEGEGEGVFH